MKFQITTHNTSSQFAKQAVQSIVANQPWEDVCRAMEGSEDASMNYALDSLKDNGEYQFHNANGEFVRVLNTKIVRTCEAN